jgi:hypothetical protein
MNVGLVCLFVADPQGVVSPLLHPIKWLMTLAGTIIATAGGVAMDNMIKRMRNTRGHNLAQVINEMLAEHQIAYPTYFVALLIAAEFKPDKFWARDIIGILVFVAFLFYAIGVYLTTLHETKLAHDHTCTGHDCPKSIKVWTGIKMYAPTMLLAGSMMWAGIYFAFATI